MKVDMKPSLEIYFLAYQVTTYKHNPTTVFYGKPLKHTFYM